jgi:ABC-type Mn2+/Zn2+ transport system ATPase subunit
MLEIRNLRISYGPVIAVDGASLQVSPDELVVITGSNGSGKSSLARSVVGLVKVADGSILVDGQAAHTAADWRGRRRDVAYVPQRTSPGSFPLLVRELLESGGDIGRSLMTADRLGIGDLLDRPVTTLSGGQLQRSYLARAFGSLGEARMIIADEPTSALDFQGQDDVAALLAEVPIARLVISHDAAVVARADRVLEMAGGSLRERAA